MSGSLADELADLACRTGATPLGSCVVLVASRTCSPRPCGRSRARRPSRAAARPRSGDDTTPTGVPPPFSTYWHAYAPMPPLAPQTSTTSPCVICAPFAAHEHAVARGVAERVDRRLLPREVRGLRHELVRLHDRELGRGRRSSSRSPRCAGWSRASSRRAPTGPGRRRSCSAR